MVWFKVDDRFHGSEPVKRLSREQRAAAIGLWTLAGTWSAQFLKDGFVPGHMIEDLGGSDELARALVEVGLWRARRDGFVFVDWDRWQPTRESVEGKRRATAERVAAHRAKKAAISGDGSGGVTRYDSVSNAPVRASRPDPTRPDPSTSDEVPRKGAAKRGSRLPEPFELDDLMRAYAKSKAPAVDVEVEHEKFVNYWRAVPGAKGVKLDWQATWRNWMLNAQKFAVRDGWKPAEVASSSAAEEAAVRDRWLAERGITLDEYREHYEEPGWLEAVERKAGLR